MKKYFLSKRALKILRVMLFFLSLALSCLARLYLSVYPMIMWACFGLFWISFVLIALIQLPIYFSKTYYFVSTSEISKQSGVFFESQQLMRVNSIQYITRIFTPFSTFTGFNFLKLNALGGYLVLLFLSKSDADDIASILTASIRKNPD